MVAVKFLSVVFTVAAGAVATSVETDLFAILLKRQQPGTPSYNCHDNCGTAITQSKQPNACTSDAFKANYNNCLQCAGPDNYNIWRYYGGTLSSAGITCGLETQPKSGKQPEVGPAIHSGGSSSAAPAASTGALSSALSQGPGSAATSLPAGTSAFTQATGLSSATALSSAASTTPSRSASRSGSGSVVTSALPQQTTNAAALLNFGHVSGVVGAVLAGALFRI